MYKRSRCYFSTLMWFRFKTRFISQFTYNSFRKTTKNLHNITHCTRRSGKLVKMCRVVKFIENSKKSQRGLVEREMARWMKQICERKNLLLLRCKKYMCQYSRSSRLVLYGSTWISTEIRSRRQEEAFCRRSCLMKQ